MVTGDDLFLLFVGPLNRAGLEYMVTGSAAAMVYGEVRLTHDVDIVIELTMHDAERMPELFPVDRFYCPDKDVLRNEILGRGRGQFNVIHHGSGFKADFYVSERRGLHQWGFDRRVRIEVEGEAVWIAPAEYVIVRKLMYFKEGGSVKHLRDIEMMIRISQEQIDQQKVAQLAEENGVLTEWKSVAK
jgi:hypothetical protein